MGMLLDLFRNKWPYTDFHELNADWIISTVRELIETMDAFIQNESISFADPITWNITTQYAKATVVIDSTGNAYLSKQAVPSGIQLNNSGYWQEIFNFTTYTRTANRNLTFNVETNTTRATAVYSVDDWIILNDVLYRVIQPIAIDDTFIISPAAGANIVHFTVEDFIKAFMTWATNTIHQYKNDIDASELQYRQQLAQDIATTTASLQAQLNAAIAGATVDSEVINARVGWDSETYATLGDAIRGQITDLHNILKSVKDSASNFLPNDELMITEYEAGYIDSDGTIVGPATPYETSGYIAVTNGVPLYFVNARYLAFYDSSKTFVERKNYQNHSGMMLYKPSANGFVRISYSTSVNDRMLSNDISVRNKIMLAISNEQDLLLLAERHDDKYWNGSAANSPNYTYFVVPIKSGVSYTITPCSRFIYYYDVDYANGVQDPDGDNNEPYTFTATRNGYAYITFEKRWVDHSVGMYKTDYYNTLHEEIGSNKCISNAFNISGTIRGRLGDILPNKTIMTFGDSIMYGAGNGNVGIGDILHSEYNNPSYDYSVAGATFGYSSGHSQIADQISSGIIAHPDCNIVLLNGGTNDLYGNPVNCPIGDMTDDFTIPDDTTTFSGGMEWAFYLLKYHYHDATIIYIGAHNMQSRDLDRQIAYRKRAIEICDKWGVAYVDMFTIMNTQLTWYNNEYLADTTHPNAKGYIEYYIPAIEHKIYELRNMLKIHKV